MIPEAAHADFSKWIRSYNDSPRYIPEANKRYQQKKIMQLSTIAYRYSKTMQEYEDLFKELQLYYDTSTPAESVYDKAPEHNEKVNTEGMRGFFTLFIIMLSDLIVFAFIIGLTHNGNRALLSIPLTTAIVYVLIIISRKQSKKH